MTYTTTTAPDKLSLDLVKSHLVVTIDDDNALIQSYIEASIGTVEDYLHASIFETTHLYFMANSPIQNEYYLSVPDQAVEIYIEYISDLGSFHLLPPSRWYEQGEMIIIPGDPTKQFSHIKVHTGLYKKINQINQARLLLIGSWYAYRENTVALKLSELPDGVRRILDNATDASL